MCCPRSYNPEDRKRERKRRTEIIAVISALCAAISAGIYFAMASTGTSRVHKISETDAYDLCVDDDSLSTAAPSDIEVTFMWIMGVFYVLMMVKLYGGILGSLSSAFKR